LNFWSNKQKPATQAGFLFFIVLLVVSAIVVQTLAAFAVHEAASRAASEREPS
jgi:hypothetical protein